MRLPNPKSSLGSFRFHHVGLCLRNHAQHLDFVIKCTECGASGEKADSRCSHNICPWEGFYYVKRDKSRKRWNRLSASSSVTADFVLRLHLHYMEANVLNNVFVLRGITQSSAVRNF